MQDRSAIAPAIARLGRLERLSELDCAAIADLPFRLRKFDVGGYIVRESDRAINCCVLLDGFAIRHKITNGGSRQILSIEIAGDFVDLQNSMLEIADHSVQALTKVSAAFVPIAAVRALAADRPAVGRALWRDTLIDAAIFREWIVNVGRRNAASRISHLLCELAVRLKRAGLVDDYGYDMPMTQEQIADAVGLTPIHVNRTLRALERDGLITREKRTIRIADWARITDVGDFNDRYMHLHLNESGDEVPT